MSGFAQTEPFSSAPTVHAAKPHSVAALSTSVYQSVGVLVAALVVGFPVWITVVVLKSGGPAVG